jgi:uncharacterized membrane protein YGL010W
MHLLSTPGFISSIISYLNLSLRCVNHLAFYTVNVTHLCDQLLYAPQLALSLLTATAFSRNPDHITQAAILHAVSWVAQFLGHGLAEKRAPALLDNLLGGMSPYVLFQQMRIVSNVVSSCGARTFLCSPRDFVRTWIPTSDA